MVKLYKCNFCKLVDLQENKKQGERVLILRARGSIGGFNLYKLRGLGPVDHRKHYQCWVSGIPGRCEC